MRLDAEAATAAIRCHVAEPLGMSVEEAALGILDIADAQMARGVRVVSVNRGHDPRGFTLVAYGGAGPMHAASVGRAVDVGAVLIPRHPGAYSALGLVSADIRYDLVQTTQRTVGSLSAGEVEGLYAPLLERAAARLASLGDGGPSRLVRTGRFRYAWQDNDVDVIVGDQPVTAASLSAAVARFHELHEFEFGYSNPEDTVELSAVALEAYGPLPRLRAVGAAEATRTDARSTSSRRVCFRETGWVESAVHERADLAPGARLEGPAIVEEREATTVVGPGVELEVDCLSNLLLRRREG